MFKVRLTALLLALLLTPAFALPAFAEEVAAAPTRAAAAQQAAELAAKYGAASAVSYAVWEKGVITLSGSSGVYSKTENRAIDQNTLYGIGSVSKIYTTAAVMKLVEQRKVLLDAPITRYLPDFKMADARYKDITVRMLLNHSSGLMGSSTNDAFLYGDTDQVATTDLIKRLSTQRLKAAPGSFSVYCNDGFTLAELIVESISKKSFTSFLQDEIWKPLGLSASFTPQNLKDTSLLAKTYLSPTETRALPPEALGVIGTGGIYTSAADLASFGGALTSPGLLSESSLKAMQNAEYQRGMWSADDADSIAYGLGWDSVKVYPFTTSKLIALSKGGDTIAYHAALVVLPEHDISVAVLSSGGVSTYNQLAAVQMALGALRDMGVTVDETPLALPAATPAAMPADLMAHSGNYGNVTQQFKLDIIADGTLSITSLSAPSSPVQQYKYHSDGSFRDETGSLLLKLIKESNGETYFFQKVCSPIPGLGYLPTAQYAAQKLAPNAVSPELQAHWDTLGALPALPVNMKYSAASYPILMQQLSASELPTPIPGYIAGLRIVDETLLQSVYQIPNAAGRDLSDLQVYEEDGVSFQRNAQGMIFRDYTDITTLYTQDSAVCTIGTKGYARWFTLAEGDAGRKMQVSFPTESGYYAYDKAGALVGSSLYGDKTFTLPAGGYIVFAGDAGARFTLSPAA